MAKVIARPNESIDSLLKRFNSAVLADGVLKELKERSRYEKPSVKKRRKKLERLKDAKNFVK
jgi:small subunit ribosomal protein S21